MRGYTFWVLASLVVTLTDVTARDSRKDETGSTVPGTSEVNITQTEMLVPVEGARHIIFRPLTATRQRNRELEKRLQEQRRRRYKSKSKSSHRNTAQTGRVQPKSLRMSSHHETWAAEPNQQFEIPNTAFPQITGDTFQHFPYPPLDDLTTTDNALSVPSHIPVSRSNPVLSPPEAPANLSLAHIHRIPASEPHFITFLLSRPRRDVISNSSEVKPLISAAKDTDDVRPSPGMMLMFSKPTSTRRIRDAVQSNSTDPEDKTKEKSDDEENMETAETVLFRPLFVHRYRKADRNRRRQLQMRPQNRPQKPQKQQSRPQQIPAARPQQRPHLKPQQARPQRPQRPVQSTSQKKKPQSTRRGQYYYVAAAGPLGQWVYYPIYYY